MFHKATTAFLIIALHTVSAAIDISTCARMDKGALDKASQGLCITSCKLQNCATGYCRERNGRPKCVCSRCESRGGDSPKIVDQNIYCNASVDIEIAQCNTKEDAEKAFKKSDDGISTGNHLKQPQQ